MNEIDEKPRKRKWAKVVLTLSLALNLLFIGAVVGARYMAGRYGANWGGPPDFVVKRLLSDLPEKKQQSILSLLASHKQSGRQEYKGIRVQYREFRQVLTREPFRAENVRQAAGRLRAVRGKLIADRTELLIQVLEQLTPKERREMFDNRFFRHLIARDRTWRSRR